VNAPRRSPLRAAAAVIATLVLTTCTAQGGGSADREAGGSTRPDGSTPTTAAPEADGPAPDPLAWTACGRFQCAELEVPVDHDAPEGAALTLAMVRRPASKPDERIGAILVNPGGPGGSAIDLAEALPLPRELTERFDIIGVDPRGVGQSTPLDCRTHLQAMYDADPTMEDDADRAAFLDISEQFVGECEANHGDLLPHLGTVDVARDMDLVRRALGDDQISWVGYSYGTSIGQQYARLFPTRVRAMVIDGVVDTTQTGLEAARDQAGGFDGALDAFIADCDAEDCGLDRPAGQAIDDVIAASEQAPIARRRADRPAGPGVVALAIAQGVRAPILWRQRAGALDDALDGNGDGLVKLADAYLGRLDDGTYPNGFEVYFAVGCLDAAWPAEADPIFTEAVEVGEDHPRVGEALVNDYVRCALWPTPPQPLEPIPSDIDGLAPIVVISTTGDPATPYEAGVRVAASIPGAVLITNEGDGHTIFAQGKRCIDTPVVDYLVDLTVPAEGIRCP
jgi:pimeloyl-ACP methyl ester carboxylesterase